LAIPRVGRGKGIAKGDFFLYHRLCRAELDSQPPPPNKLSEGGWELEAEAVVKEKREEVKIQKERDKKRRRSRRRVGMLKRAFGQTRRSQKPFLAR
jgi:hypothetical protein